MNDWKHFGPWTILVSKIESHRRLSRFHWCALDKQCRESYNPNRIYLRFFRREILIDFAWAWWEQLNWDKLKPVEIKRKGTSMSDPGRINEVLFLISEHWKRNPDQRLGQLLCNLTRPKYDAVVSANPKFSEAYKEWWHDLTWGIEEDELVKKLKEAIKEGGER